MNAQSRITSVTVAFSAIFAVLACVFALDLVGHPRANPTLAIVDSAFTNKATVRLSAAQQFKAGADTSGLDCYGCHERKKPPVVKFDAAGNVVLPKEHEDLVMLHGRNNRNESCYNCHDPENLDMLKVRDGKTYKWEDSTQLCASCHGTTYRDWKVGIHGRTGGYWDRKRGAAQREECASCHHPHAPQFPPIAPAPGPHLLHSSATHEEKAH